MELSTRLQAVADFVTAGYKLADIGTDHAYIPIALVEQNRIPGAIAMDINEGPLQRAGEHIAENKMEKYDYSHSNAGNRILGIFYLPTGTFWHTNGNYDHASAVCYQLNYRIRT